MGVPSRRRYCDFGELRELFPLVCELDEPGRYVETGLLYRRVYNQTQLLMFYAFQMSSKIAERGTLHRLTRRHKDVTISREEEHWASIWYRTLEKDEV